MPIVMTNKGVLTKVLSDKDIDEIIKFFERGKGGMLSAPVDKETNTVKITIEISA